MSHKGIVVSTWSGGEEPCTLLLKSLWNVKYPVLIVINNALGMSKEWWRKLYAISGEQMWHVYEQDFDGFEVGAIAAALVKTKWDEIILLQDTIEIKDQRIFDILFEDFDGQSVSYNPHFQMYLGKYRREILEKMTFPEVRDKVEAVRQEWTFTKTYRDFDGDTRILNPNFIDDNFYESWEDIFGRKNMRMEDDFIIKRKATWSSTQI